MRRRLVAKGTQPLANGVSDSRKASGCGQEGARAVLADSLHAVHGHPDDPDNLSAGWDEDRGRTFLSSAAILHHWSVDPGVEFCITAFWADPERTIAKDSKNRQEVALACLGLRERQVLSTIIRTVAQQAADLDE